MTTKEVASILHSISIGPNTKRWSYSVSGKQKVSYFNIVASNKVQPVVLNTITTNAIIFPKPFTVWIGEEESTIFWVYKINNKLTISSEMLQ